MSTAKNDEMRTVEVRLLGTLEVIVDGAPLALGAPKPSAVLAMLALDPGRVRPAEWLAVGLWGEDPPPSAGNTLQGYISQLRRVLGRDSIVTRFPGYYLAVSPEAVDARRFEQLMAEGRAALGVGRADTARALLEDALALWRGPALTEFAYAPFSQAEAVRLEELWLVATEELIEAKLALGRHAELVSELRVLVDGHPLRERLWGQLMRALYRCGRQAEALRAFADLRQHLGEELGIPPSPALQRLEEAMVLQSAELEWRGSPSEIHAAAASATPPNNLRVPRSSFVGRDDELAEVRKLLDTAAVATVVGPGGSGKSRLALELARQVVVDHPGGVWLVELASVSEPALVPQVVATAVGVRVEPGRPLTETLAAALDGRALLVLDNCEHLVDACAALVDTLVRTTPSLTVLATSREPLRVDGEVLWRIPTLAVPADDSVPAEALIDYDAVRLFVERASAQGSYAWDPSSAAAVARVCRRLDGLPLAIELAASRTRVLTPAAIAERLDQRFDLLTAGVRTALPRHRTLRATVDWSHEMLRPMERVLFRRLAVFAGGCSVSAAEEVCSGEGLDAADVLDVLATLVDRSLVATAERGGEIRYTLHETLRAYAQERLAEATEEDTFRARHLAWTLTFAESQKDALAPQFVTHKSTLDRVDLEHDNIRQALRCALSIDATAALRLVAAVGPYWRLRGYIDEGRRWMREVLVAAPEDADLRLKAVVLRLAGSLALQQGDVPHGRSLVEESVAISRKFEDGQSVALGLGQLLWPAFMYDRDWSHAEDLVQQCIDIHNEGGDDHMASEATMLLAFVRARRGDEATARRLMSQALEYNARHPEDPCMMLHSRAGEIALIQGNLQLGRQHLEQAIAHNRGTGQPLPLAGELGWLAEVAFLEGDVNGAHELLTEQLSTAQEQCIWVWTRHALMWLAKVAIHRCDLTSARSNLEEVRLMSRMHGGVVDPREIELAATLLAAEGRFETAARMLGAAEAHRDALGEPLPAAYGPELKRLENTLRSELGAQTFNEARQGGRQINSEEAVERALANTTRIDVDDAPAF